MADRAPCPRTWLTNSTLVFPLAALAAATMAFVTCDQITPRLVGLVALSLAPWALLAGGLALHDGVLAVATTVPAVVAIVSLNALGAEFFIILTVVWITSRSRGVILPLCASVAGTSAAFAVSRHNAQPPNGHVRDWLLFAAGMAFSWFAGLLLRRERQLVGQLEDAHALLGDAAAAEERRRIARDVHDIVGHSLTVVLLNIAGARRLVRTDPGAAIDALEQAEASGRESLEHVRSTVGLLRDGTVRPSATPPAGPLPDVHDLAELAERSQAAGVDAALRIEGDLGWIDPAINLGVYRVVQEALTNAGRHAPGARVDVRVRAGRERVEVRVANERPAHGAARSGVPGAGLAGMRERVASVGGTCTAGPTPDGGWAVTAELPARLPDTADASR